MLASRAGSDRSTKFRASSSKFDTRAKRISALEHVGNDKCVIFSPAPRVSIRRDDENGGWIRARFRQRTDPVFPEREIWREKRENTNPEFERYYFDAGLLRGGVHGTGVDLARTSTVEALMRD